MVASADDAWAAGDAGPGTLILHWNGRSWRVSASPVPRGAAPLLYGISAASARDAWAVGTAGGRVLLEHWNGARWRVVASPQPDPAMGRGLSGISSTSASDVWIAGYYAGGGKGLLARRVGNRWRLAG